MGCFDRDKKEETTHRRRERGAKMHRQIEQKTDGPDMHMCERRYVSHWVGLLAKEQTEAGWAI